ncbi:hypothetical protein CLOM_g10296 [Closterium sp. NIES-68]|nr:hypothetical protein CLOM_g10296 [Closterium sp. NIES-68]
MPNTQYRLRQPTRYGKQPAVPSEFVCPLSLQLLTDPVITASGLTFERAVIQKWYRDGNRICPVTGSRLDHYRLFPNQAVRQLIAQWCDANAVPYAPGVLCVRVDPQAQQGGSATGSFRGQSVGPGDGGSGRQPLANGVYQQQQSRSQQQQQPIRQYRAQEAELLSPRSGRDSNHSSPGAHSASAGLPPPGPFISHSQRPITPPGTPPKSPRSAAPFSAQTRTLPGAFQRPRTPPSGAEERPFTPPGGENVPRNFSSASLSVSRSVSSGGPVQRVPSGSGAQGPRGSPAGAMVPRTASGGGAVLRVVLGGGVPRVSSADSPRARISSAERIGSSPLSGDELGAAGARRQAGAPPNGAGPPQRRQAPGPRHRGSQSQVLRVLRQDGAGDGTSSGLARSHSLQPKADDIESLLNALEDDDSDGYESAQSDALWRANEPLPVPRVASLGGRGTARGPSAGRGGIGMGRGGRGGRGAMADGVGRSDSLERGVMRAKQQGHAGLQVEGSLRPLNGRNGIPPSRKPAQGGGGGSGGARGSGESGLLRTSSLQSQGVLSASLGSLGLDAARDSFRGAVDDLVARRGAGGAGAGGRGEGGQSRFAGESGGESSSERETRRGATGRPGGGIPPGARLLAAGRASQSFRDRASSDGSDSDLKAALFGAVRSSSAGSHPGGGVGCAGGPAAGGGGGGPGGGGAGAGGAAANGRAKALRSSGGVGMRSASFRMGRELSIDVPGAAMAGGGAAGGGGPRVTGSGSLRSPMGSSSMRVTRDGAMGSREAAIEAALRATATPRSPVGRSSSSSLQSSREFPLHGTAASSSASMVPSGEWGAAGAPRSPGGAAVPGSRELAVPGSRELAVPRSGSRELAVHANGPPLADSPTTRHTAPAPSARQPPPPLALRRDLSMDTWALASHLPASGPLASAPVSSAPLSPIHSSGPLSPMRASDPPSPRLSSAPLSPRLSSGPRSPMRGGNRSLGGQGGSQRWRRDGSVEGGGDAGSGRAGAGAARSRHEGGGGGGRSPPMLQRSLGRRVVEEGALLRSGSIQSVQSVGQQGGGAHGYANDSASDADDPFLSALSSARRDQQQQRMGRTEGGMRGGEDGGLGGKMGGGRERNHHRGSSSLAQSEGEGRTGSDWESDESSVRHRRAAGAGPAGSRLGHRDAGGAAAAAAAGTSSGRNVAGGHPGRRHLHRGSSQTDHRGLGRAAERALQGTLVDRGGAPVVAGMTLPGGSDGRQGLRRASSLAVVGGSGRQQGMGGMDGNGEMEGFHEVLREMKADTGALGGRAAPMSRGDLAVAAELSLSHRRGGSVAVQSRSSSSMSMGGSMAGAGQWDVGEGRVDSRRMSGGSGGGPSSRRSDFSLPPDATALLDELDGPEGSEADEGDPTCGSFFGGSDSSEHHVHPTQHSLERHALEQQEDEHEQQHAHPHQHAHQHHPQHHGQHEAQQQRVGRVGGTFAWLREALRSPLKSPKPAPPPLDPHAPPLSPRSAHPALPGWGGGSRPATPPSASGVYGKSATVPAPEKRSLWGEARRAVGLGEGGGGDGGKGEEFRRSSSEQRGQGGAELRQWTREGGAELDGRGGGGRSGAVGRGGRGQQGQQGRGVAVAARDLGEGRNGSPGSSMHEGGREGGRGGGGRGLGGGAGRGGGRGGEGVAEGGVGGGRGRGWAKVRAVFPLQGEGRGQGGGAGGRGPGRGMGEGGRGELGRGGGGRAGPGPGLRQGGAGGAAGGREGGDSGRLSLERTSSLSSNHHATAMAAGAGDLDRDVDGPAHPLSALAAAAAASPPDMVPLVRAVAHGADPDRLEAVAAIRALVKGSRENKARLIAAGGVPALVRVLRHPHPTVKEHAVTAILNLSLVPGAPAIIASVGGIDAVAAVLQSGSQVARENAAAALFALSVDDGNQCLVRRAGAVLPLVDVLRAGSTRGRKDAALVLFNLSRDQRSRAEIVQAGAVGVLVGMLGSAEGGLEEKAMAVLANLCRMPEGCQDVLDMPGAIPTLVRVVGGGSQRAKEDAVMTLLMLANSDPTSCHAMLAESMVPALQQVAHTGSTRSKGKARALLDLLTSQAQRGRAGRDR